MHKTLLKPGHVFGQLSESTCIACTSLPQPKPCPVQPRLLAPIRYPLKPLASVTDLQRLYLADPVCPQVPTSPCGKTLLRSHWLHIPNPSQPQPHIFHVDIHVCIDDMGTWVSSSNTTSLLEAFHRLDKLYTRSNQVWLCSRISMMTNCLSQR